MNISAVLYGQSIHNDRTLASLKRIEKTNIISCHTLKQVYFDQLTGDYTFFIKSGDVISKDAIDYLQLNFKLFEPDILYSDEKILCESSGKELIFHKPDYSNEMILSMNYFRNLLCVKTSLLREAQCIQSQNDENALYEIVLKILSKSKVITHVREALYFSYSSKSFVNYSDFFGQLDSGAVRKLLEDYCKDNYIDARVLDGRYHGTFRLQYHISTAPLISVIIPFRDKPELLKCCVNSILEKSTYQHFEIIGVNNGSKDKKTLRLMQELQLKDERIQFYDLDIPFNYSIINNYAANYLAKGEHLLFLNNDTSIIEPGWLEAMLEYSQCEKVGIVGAKLLYPDFTIQHCGMICNPYPEHVHRELADNDPGYFYFPHVVRNYHILTFACVMVKTALFKQVGGLYEKFAVDFNDVDICARISALGYRNVYTPYAVLFHYESKSRGDGNGNVHEKIIRRRGEYAATIERTPSIFVRDSLSHETSGDGILRELEAMQGALSWRITRPLRIGKKCLKFLLRTK